MARRPPSWLVASLGVDPRSLALLRIGLALLLLANLLGRAPYLEELYGDSGVFPRALAGRVYLGWDAPYFAYLWNGSPAALAAVSGLAALCAVALLVGFHSRLAAAASWFLLCSLHARNPLAASYEDQVMILLLFFAAFLPLGRRFALDARASPEPADDRPILSPASAALLIQFACIYFFSGLLKTGPAWHEEASAVYYAVSQSYVARPHAAWAAAQPEVLAGLTRVAYVWELSVGALLLTPLWGGLVRAAAVASVLVFHTGLAAFLALGLFPWTMMVGALTFLPAAVWRAGRGWRRGGGPPHREPRGLLAWVPAVCCAYVLLFNASGLAAQHWLPESLRWLGGTLRLNQSWAMYAPEPERFDYYYDLTGTLPDGSRVDLMRDGAAVRAGPPPERPRRHASRAWALYLDHVRVHRQRGLARPLASWHCRRWNDRPEDGPRLVSVEWRMERYGLDRERRHQSQVLGRWRCGNPAEPADRADRR